MKPCVINVHNVFYSFQLKAKKILSMLINCKKVAFIGNGCQYMMDIRNKRLPIIINVIYSTEVLEIFPFSAVGFSHRQNTSIIGTSAEDNAALSLVIFYYVLDALKVFFTGY